MQTSRSPIQTLPRDFAALKLFSRRANSATTLSVAPPGSPHALYDAILYAPDRHTQVFSRHIAHLFRAVQLLALIIPHVGTPFCRFSCHVFHLQFIASQRKPVNLFLVDWRARLD